MSNEIPSIITNKNYKRDFIQFALENNVLCFGEFTLKSGRKSPYFFNAGMFRDGKAFSQLSQFYANTITRNFSRVDYDIIFGPAYKGISLGTAAAIGLFELYGFNIPVTFNRKEAKDHGEGGSIIGADLKDKKAILIDDVITAGITIKDSLKIITDAGGTLAGVTIALDRQEKGTNSKISAIQEIENDLGIKISSIITLADLIEYLQTRSNNNDELQTAQHLQNLLAYQADYGI